MTRLTRERKNRTVYRMIEECHTQGLVLKRAQSGNGPRCVVDGKSLRNFGSCSYMGLENHPALLAGAAAALEAYGCQFSFSRAFLESPLYQTLEAALEYIEDDELVEVTPDAIRLRKILLTENDRKRADRAAKGGK